MKELTEIEGSPITGSDKVPYPLQDYCILRSLVRRNTGYSLQGDRITGEVGGVVLKEREMGDLHPDLLSLGGKYRVYRFGF